MYHNTIIMILSQYHTQILVFVLKSQTNSTQILKEDVIIKIQKGMLSQFGHNIKNGRQKPYELYNIEQMSLVKFMAFKKKMI